MSDAAKLKDLLEAVRRHCHELRQPLLGIRGYADMMADTPADADLVTEGATQVATQAERIARLVDELAALATQMAGAEPHVIVPAADSRSTEVVPPVEEAIKLFGYRTGERIALRAELPNDLPRVRMPRDHLERIAINLLSNALDATGGRGGVVHVRARADDGQVLLEVGDDGAGIAEEVRENLFVPGASTKGTTHGLGLAICRELARAAGGDLVLAEGDSGPPWPHAVKTVFRLSLPAD
jgi:signal transduction histidine kinase